MAAYGSRNITLVFSLPLGIIVFWASRIPSHAELAASNAAPAPGIRVARNEVHRGLGIVVAGPCTSFIAQSQVVERLKPLSHPVSIHRSDPRSRV
jgi:hypothetical protein